MDILYFSKIRIQFINCLVLVLQKLFSFLTSRFYSQYIEIKEVTKDDYEKVLSIRDSKDIEDGRDYLPDLYHHLMSCPENAGFCAVQNNKFIAFALVTLINDGTTIVLRSARIHKCYSGRGVVKILIHSIFKRYLSTKNVKLCWISFSQNYFFEKMEKDLFKLITLRKSAIFRGDMTSIVSLHNRTGSEVEAVDVQTLSQIFQRKDIVKAVFPTHCIVSHFVPFKPILENVPLILNLTPVMLVTYQHDPYRIIISIGNLCNGLEFASYFIGLYGNVQDKENLADHLNMHIEYCKKNLRGPVEMRVTTDECIDLDEFTCFFRHLNLRKHREKYMIIAERNLKTFR